MRHDLKRQYMLNIRNCSSECMRQETNKDSQKSVNSGISQLKETSQDKGPDIIEAQFDS